MDQIIQVVIQASICKRDLSGDKLKAKSSDIYCGRLYIKCYNFCQQCENYFVTIEATEPNQIPFATSFFQNQINFD